MRYVVFFMVILLFSGCTKTRKEYVLPEVPVTKPTTSTSTTEAKPQTTTTWRFYRYTTTTSIPSTTTMPSDITTPSTTTTTLNQFQKLFSKNAERLQELEPTTTTSSTILTTTTTTTTIEGITPAYDNEKNYRRYYSMSETEAKDFIK